MGEMTAETDEEVMKQDLNQEPLPEPLLIILSPPPPFLPVPGEPAMFWDKWIKAFEHYIDALGENELIDSTKRVLLQNCLGSEGQRVFTALIPSETTYAAAVSALTVFFSSDLSSQMNCLKFHQRAQTPGETVDQFVSALEDLLKPCNCGDLQDRLILDQLIEKTNCLQLRERLLLERETLTLDKALVIGKELERALNESELFGVPEVSVDIGDCLDPPVQRKARRGRPRRGETRMNNKTKPCSTRTLKRSSRYKDNYYYMNDKLYYSDNDEDKSRSADDTNLASDKTSSHDGSLSKLSQENKEEDKASDGVDDEDKDFVMSSTKLKGPHCPICVNRRFRDANKLARHMRMHTKEKPFSCPVCALTFSQSYHVTRHVRNQHGAGPHVCSTCGKSFGFSELKYHQSTHTSQSLSCLSCHETNITNSVDLLSRTSSHSKDQSTSTEEQSLQKSDEGENREITESSDKDNVESDDCNDDGAANDADSVNGDSQNKESEVGVKAEEKIADEAKCEDGRSQKEKVLPNDKTQGSFCPICVNRRFRDANKLARHMRTHTKEKPFSCPVCALTFSQSYHMTRHLRNQHGAGPHICSTCGKSFESFSELQCHRKTHLSRNLSCLSCHEKFTNSVDLLSHTLSHHKDRSTSAEGQSSQKSDEGENQEITESSDKDNVESDDCNDDAAGSDADSVNGDSQNDESEAGVNAEDGQKEKVMSNTKTKGHFCPICVNRRFRGPNKLARHMRTHTKEKPFTCPVCAMTFSQSYHMTRHVRNQHRLGQYICPKCGKSLGSWLELKAHKKTHAVEGLTCLACDKQFKEKSALVSHLKLHKKVQSSPRSLICGSCGKVFGRLYHLKRHLVSHRKATNAECYTCPDCQKNFAFPEDLNKHLEIHVKENNGICPKCNETFSSPEELEKHVVVHEKSYACNTCGKKFKVEYALKKHEQGHKEEQYYCSLCRKRFIKLSHYKRHIMVHDRRESRCPHCDSVFLQLTALKYHLRTHTEERPYQCTCCIETFEKKGDLEQHCLKHRKFKRERPYSCTRCDHAFSTLLELTEHMSSHEGEQPLNCPFCGRTFLNKNKLDKHLSIHTGERPHLCSICGNGFPSAASLKLHIHIHTGEKPFQCSQCSKSFRSSSGLRLHSRQHMEVRPTYECPECGRTYGRMTELKMHQRYHTGDKPYACTCCNKRFISKDKLNVHMRIHTGERPYSCPHCGQTFTQTGDRNRHISKYH